MYRYTALYLVLFKAVHQPIKKHDRVLFPLGQALELNAKTCRVCVLTPPLARGNSLKAVPPGWLGGGGGGGEGKYPYTNGFDTRGGGGGGGGGGGITCEGADGGGGGGGEGGDGGGGAGGEGGREGGGGGGGGAGGARGARGAGGAGGVGGAGGAGGAGGEEGSCAWTSSLAGMWSIIHTAFTRIINSSVVVSFSPPVNARVHTPQF